MKKFIVDVSGRNHTRSEEAELVCGEHFCDICGDCLACYGVDTCWETGGEHYWIEYEDEQ